MTAVQFQADADLNQAIVTINTITIIWEASTAEEWVNQIMSIPF